MKKLAVFSGLLAAVCALGAGIWDGLGEDPLGPNGAPVAGNGGGSEFLPFPGKGQPTPRPRGPGAVDFFVSTNNQTYEGFPGARSFGLQGSGTVRLRLLTDDLYDPRVEIIGDEYNETNTVTIKQGDYDSGPQPVNSSPVFELPAPDSPNTITIRQEGTGYVDTQSVASNPVFTIPDPPAEFEETNTVTLYVPGQYTSTQPVSNSPNFTLPDPEITIVTGDSSMARKVWGSPTFYLPDPKITVAAGDTSVTGRVWNSPTLALPSPEITVSSRVGNETHGVWGSPTFTLPDPTITLSSGGSSVTKHVLDDPEFRYISPPNPDDYADWLWATNMDGTTANIYAYVGNREDVTVPEYLDGYKVVSLDARYTGPESVSHYNMDVKGKEYDFIFDSDSYYPWAQNWIATHTKGPGGSNYVVSIRNRSAATRAQVRDIVASGDLTDCFGEDALDALVDDYMDSLVTEVPGNQGGGSGVSLQSVFPQYYGNSLNVDNGFYEGFGYNRIDQGVFARNCENARAAGHRPDNFNPKTVRWDGVEWPFGGYGFAQSGLEEAYMPHVYWVGQYAFVGCDKLVSARFPELRGKVGMLAFSSTKDLAVLDLGFVSNLPGTVFGSSVSNAANLQIWIDGPRPTWTTNKNSGNHWTTTGFDHGPDGLVTHYRRGMPGWDEYWSDEEKLVDGPGMFGMRAAVAEATTFEEPGGWGTLTSLGSGNWSVSSNQVGAFGNFWLGANVASVRLDDPVFVPYGTVRRVRLWGGAGGSAVHVQGGPAGSEYDLGTVSPGEVKEYAWGDPADKWRFVGPDLADDLASVKTRVGALETNTAAWSAEVWTFILTNGTSVTKRVVVEDVP